MYICQLHALQWQGLRDARKKKNNKELTCNNIWIIRTHIVTNLSTLQQNKNLIIW